jgi:uncharacterized membrane protein
MLLNSLMIVSMTEKKTSTEDVPKELQQHAENKQMAEERAADEIKQQVTRGECFLSGIGYIGFLCVLPLVLLPESKFGQFHGKQALVLAIVVYFLDVLTILPTSVEAIYTILKYGIILFAAYMALNAKMVKIPFIFDLSNRFQLHVQKKSSEADAE